jgi:hypothetical protein
MDEISRSPIPPTGTPPATNSRPQIENVAEDSALFAGKVKRSGQISSLKKTYSSHKQD